MVRPGDNDPPSGHKMETDAREYLEAKTEGRSQRPSVVQPRQEKKVLQPILYRRQALANTSSNPVLNEYRQENIPTEGHAGALEINLLTSFSARIMESPPFPKVKLPTV